MPALATILIITKSVRCPLQNMQRLHRFPESLLGVLKQKISKVLTVSEEKDFASSRRDFSWVCLLRPLLVGRVSKRAALSFCFLHLQLGSRSRRLRGRGGAMHRVGLPVVATVARPMWICMIPSQHTEHRITDQTGSRVLSCPSAGLM